MLYATKFMWRRSKNDIVVGFTDQSSWTRHIPSIHEDFSKVLSSPEKSVNQYDWLFKNYNILRSACVSAKAHRFNCPAAELPHDVCYSG